MRFARSTRFEIVRRFLAAVADHLVIDHLTLVERTQAGALDRGDMDEYVSAAVLRLNETVALRRVEPFHGASSHHGLLACTNLIAAARPSCDRSSEVSVASGKAPGRCATNKAKIEYRQCTRFPQELQPREVIENKRSNPLDNRPDTAQRQQAVETQHNDD